MGHAPRNAGSGAWWRRLLIHMDRRADELDEECRRIAIGTCGYRRVKRFTVRRTLASLSEPGGLSHDCDFECM